MKCSLLSIFLLGTLALYFYSNYPKYKVGECFTDGMDTGPYRIYGRIVGVGDTTYTYKTCMKKLDESCNWSQERPIIIDFKDLEHNKDGHGKTHLLSPISCEEI
jgi:hypothetical protein